MDQAQLYASYETDPAPEVAFLAHLATGCAPDGPLRVLDVGCGPGRLLRPLAALGWHVTGLEPDPVYADAAARKNSDVARLEVRRAGFADLADTAAFDLIAAVNGPFSYLLTHDERRDALERCARALRPGGLLFLHFSNFWWILKHYRPPPERTVEVNDVAVTRTARHEIDYHAGRFTHVDTFRWTAADGTRHEVEKTHRMAMVTPPETERLLRRAGLVDPQTYDSFEDREPARLTGKRVLITARRPR